MHVVHLYDGHEKVYGGKGSVPGVVWNVARETASRGHDVTVIERKWDGLSARSRHEGVAFQRIELQTGPVEPWERVPYEMVDSALGIVRLVADRTNFALQALRRLRQFNYDVLHVHLPFAANVIVTVAPHLRRRMVYTAHLGELRLNAIESEGKVPDSSDDGLSVPTVLQRLSPDVYLAQRSARTTVLNPNIRSVLVAEGVSSESFDVVPNGVDFDRFSDPEQELVDSVVQKYDLNGATTVLFVGTVMPRKGVHDLVRAVGDVRDEHGDVRLLIAGETELDTDYVTRVQTLIQNCGISECTDMLGFVSHEELPALYAAADVFVMPSLEEGFGMTAVEAMAAGTPVIGTRVGGIPWLLEDGEHGYVVPPGDVRALAHNLGRLVGDSEERERFGRRARERARAFGWSRIAADFEKIYHEVQT